MKIEIISFVLKYKEIFISIIVSLEAFVDKTEYLRFPPLISLFSIMILKFAEAC